MRPWLAWALVMGAGLLLLLADARGAAAQTTVTVQGQLVNGTAGASLAAELRVVLHSFSANGGLAATVQTVADAQGRFRFSDVALRDTGSYAFAVEYAGVTYTAVASPSDLTAPVQLKVYEATQDLAAVRVERQVWFISEVDVGNQTVAAVEIILLVNGGDRTLLPDLTNPGQISFLRFSLPPGAAGLEVDSDLPGGQVIPIGAGFAVTAPVFPGPHDLTFAYRFPYRGTGISYNQRLLQGAEVYQVLVPQRLSTVQVAGLEPQPPLELDGALYRVWEGRGFRPGQGPVLSLSGLPQPSLPARLTRGAARPAFWEAAIPGALGAALALLLAYGLVKAPGRARVAAALAPESGGLGGRRALVGAIAALDRRFQQGGLDQSQYLVQRQRLKAQAAALDTGGEAAGAARPEDGGP
jgi:hypothetical protein